MNKNIPIGDLIRQSRIKFGFRTQKEFAEKTGVSPAALSRIEKNTQKPTLETLQQLSRHLGNVTCGELMQAAGYLSCADPEDEEVIIRLMDDHELLDCKVRKIFDSFYTVKDFSEKVFPAMRRVFMGFGLDGGV